MRIHRNFVGGNISVKEICGDTVTLENELRDTTEDWFYWAFCIEGAENRTLTFRFQQTRLGYFGPAVSHDLVNWHWLDSRQGDSFTYRFGETEHRVYFAHSMLYHPARFEGFAERHGLAVRELCRSSGGSSVPCVSFGAGETSILLTARHHACESTGNYVLEGVLETLLASPIPGAKVFCVPFVDYEGVIRGDQGKSRAPHDHNRDYDGKTGSLYPECRALRAYAEANGCHFGFDFHSPWHLSGEHDTAFIVQNSVEKLDRLRKFGRLLEASVTEESFRYRQANDYPPGTGWNRGGAQFANFLTKRPENVAAFSFETAYFGTQDNRVTAEKLLELGRCFGRAMGKFVEAEGPRPHTAE